MLAVLVLLAHALVLQTHPAHFGQALAPDARRAPTFATRSIPPAPAPAQISPPPAEAAPPVQAQAQSAAKPVKKPILKKKMAVAQEAPAPPAIETIAEPVPETIIADTETGTYTAPQDKDNAPARSTDEAGETAEPAATGTGTDTAATAPLEAASTQAAPPPVPSSTPVTAMALPASARLDYKMTGRSKGLTYYAKGEMNWQNKGGRYDASMTVSALFIGSRTMSSTGQIGDEGLAPSRFSDKSRNEVAAHFEPDKGQISFSANTPVVAWSPGAQDRVSVFLQLGGMLAGNPAGFPVGSAITMLTVGPRDADNWTFVVENEQALSLPFGDLATLKLSRKPRREYDQTVEIWFAPALGYLPVRNKITQANGDFVDQQLSALTRP
jgi:hypothetical protein